MHAIRCGRLTTRDTKRVNRHIINEVCPWNLKFARALRDGSPFAAREFLAGKDAAALARDLPALDAETYRAAFRGSAMKRAKRAGLQRNARVVLGEAIEGSDAERM